MAIGLYLLWRFVRPPALPIAKDFFPLDEERAAHLPLDEATLRSLNLGPNTERIVELYLHGQLARGVLIKLDTIETRVGPNTTSTQFFYRYAWYDLHGKLRKHRTDDPNSGLLNHQFELKRQDIFLVGYDLASKDHVIFYSDGGARRVAPPAAAPWRPKMETKQRTAPDLASVEALLSAAHEQSDDLHALSVIADRLCELGEPRGEFITHQLAHGKTEPHTDPKWIPHGLDPSSARFRHGFLVEVTCHGTVSVQLDHLGWKTIEVLRFGDFHRGLQPHPLAAGLPRLRELHGMASTNVQAMLPRISKKLEVLQLSDAVREATTLLLTGLPEYPALHTLGFQSLIGMAQPIDLIELVLRHRPPRLTHLWVPGYLFNGLEVQQRIAAVPELVVHFTFGEHAWVEMTAQQLTLHQRGEPQRAELVQARRMMTACGIHDATVYSQPL